MEREIIHLLLPSFSLQVLIGDRYKFSNYPSVLCGRDSPSARIFSISPRASLEGIKRGMILGEARRRCSRLEVYTPCPSLFYKAKRAVFSFLGNFSPVIEPNRGGFYLDLTGTRRLLGVGADVGSRILQELKSGFELVSSVGISRNKLVSRMASGIVSAPSLAQVLAFEEKDFLSPFPLKKVLRDSELAIRLEEMGIFWVSDLQRFSLGELVSSFGDDGHRLYLLAQGIDFSPVISCDSIPELEEGESLAEATNNLDKLTYLLFRLCRRLGRELRRINKRVGMVRLLLVYRDGRSSERRGVLKEPSAIDYELFITARSLLEKAFSRRVQVIYLGIRASRLVSSCQMDLFGEIDKKERLYLALDKIWNKYGEESLRFGIELCSA